MGHNVEMPGQLRRVQGRWTWLYRWRKHLLRRTLIKAAAAPPPRHHARHHAKHTTTAHNVPKFCWGILLGYTVRFCWGIGMTAGKEKTMLETIKKEITERKYRSAWDKGVTVYALEILGNLGEAIQDGYFDEEDLAAPKILDKAMLNGADSWEQYSWGGCSLIYDGDIAERLCSPSELKKTRNGERRPNSREEWLDTQARALRQAAWRVKDAARKATKATA